MWKLSVAETNPDAWPELQAQGELNDPPAEGMSYVSTIMTITTEPDSAPEGVDPSASLMAAYVTPNGRSYDAMQCDALLIPEPGAMFEIGLMYPDATAEAYLCAIVPAPDVSGGSWRVGYIGGGSNVFFAGA